MKKNGIRAYFFQSAMAASIVVLICTGLIFSDSISKKLVFASACTAFPQGGAVLLEKYVYTSDVKVGNETVASVDTPETMSTAGKVQQEIPEDIERLIKEAEKKAENEKKDGDIREMEYGKASSTDDINGILIKDSTEENVDFEELLEKPSELIIDTSKPSVLLFHTHTTEGYEMLDRDWYASDVTSRTEDASRNIVRVGDAVEEALMEAGFKVIHDKTIHDLTYSGSYDRSRETVKKHLEENPQLAVTIDIHRDAIQENNGTKIKAVKEVDGKKAAQIMIISGAEGGKVTDFPLWRDNLSFALKLHDACEDRADGIMRPLMFCYRKYNMDLTPYSLLVEFGSEANTLDEAVRSGKLFGEALGNLLKKYTREAE